MNQYLRELPAIHELKRDRRFHSLVEDNQISTAKVTELLQGEVDLIRERILNNNRIEEEIKKSVIQEEVFDNVEARIDDHQQYQLKRVINATGTILHTNLGRAKLSEEAIKQVVLAAGNYTNLEYDIENCQRGSRHNIVESIVKEVTGAEAAMVVNNNAAAVYLILRTLAKEKEVIVSRGELVEIGGSFRISSIMEESDAKLVEVGTTNKTYLSDYKDALNEDTSIFMKVHTSNFKTIGFTESVKTQELSELSSQYENVLVYEDLGSGALYNFTNDGIGDEPTVKKVLSSGADIVSFSGDKLLGGPQAGIIVGKRNLISKLKKHQLARVLRVDKMTLAAMESTLKAYIQGKYEQIPTVRDLKIPLAKVKEQAESFIYHFKSSIEDQTNWQLDLREETSQIGGGTMPGVEVSTFAVAIAHSTFGAQKVFELLHIGDPVIVTRIKEEKVFIDFRTVSEEEIPLIVDRLKEISLLIL